MQRAETPSNTTRAWYPGYAQRAAQRIAPEIGQPRSHGSPFPNTPGFARTETPRRQDVGPLAPPPFTPHRTASMPAPSQIPTPQPQNERHEDTSQAPIGKAPDLWDAWGMAPGGKGLPRPTETTRESPESTPRPATPPSTPDPSPTPATWDLSDMRQAYMSTPRTETTPAGARTPVGGPPTEMQMLTLMQPQNRHMIPESTPGAQAKLQDDDGRPRLHPRSCAPKMGPKAWVKGISLANQA